MFNISMKKKINNKNIFKYFGLIFAVYLFVSLLIVPEISKVNAEVVFGAHRGASVEFEENTMEAFEQALDNPEYKFVEFDIQYTKDKKIVVFHENNMVKIPKKFVDTSNMTYNELNEEFEFEIAQYGEVVSLLAGKKPLDIEIKSHGYLEQDKELVDFVIQDCKNRGILDQIMISAISGDVIEYIEEKYPEIKTGKIYWVTFASIMPITSICEEIYDTPADYVLLHGYNLYNYETLKDCKPEDTGLIFWYFTDEVYIINDNQNYEFWENSQ